jgi:hypothetical protein
MGDFVCRKIREERTNMIVESESMQRRKQQPSVNVDYNYAAPGCAWGVGIPSLLFLVALISASGKIEHTFMAGAWPYFMGFFALVLTPCVAVVGWHFYRAKKAHEYQENKRRSEQRLLSEQVKLTKQANALVQESRANGDNVKLSFGDNGGLKSIEVIRAAVLLEQANINQQNRVKVSEQKQLAQTAGGANGYHPALPAPAQEQEEDEPVLPVAPAFSKIAHLITTARMPLCFVVDRNDNNRVIPMFGTIDDLLSMAITGKPGRGKTVALMYYVAMLLKNGAEVYVFDPHGAMAELAVLNNRVLPAMPATARIHYFDRKETITGAVPGLYRELEQRDSYYRPALVDGEIVTRRVKHPLLVLADELPILADFDEQVALEYKRVNRQRLKDGEEELEVPSLIYLIRRIVLEARKWRCFFIGSGQSMDAEVLPTKVTENLNSRIVFFSSNRRARMSGLENDAIKNLLPLIRRAGSGVMIYDCARWDEPVIGAIPYITVDDLLEFLGVDVSTLGDGSGMFGDGSTGVIESLSVTPKTRLEASGMALKSVSAVRNTGALEMPVSGLIEPMGSNPDESPFGPDDMRFSEEQVREFMKLFKALGNRKECLRRMRNPRAQSGYGVSNRYDRHARLIVEQYQLDVNTERKQ